MGDTVSAAARTLASRADLPGAPMSSTLDFDAPCRRCGYNLRGLSLESACPECGGAVALSLRGDRLVYTEPSHLARLARGARLIAIGAAVYLIASVLGFVLSIVAAVWLAPGQGTGLALGMNLLSSAITLPGVAVIAIGWWGLTTPDPGRLGGATDSRARRWARWSLVGVVLGSVLTLGLIASTGAGAPVTMTLLALAPTLLASLLWLVHYYAGLLYTRRLLRRATPNRLMGLSTVLLWAPLIYVGACILGPLALIVLLGFYTALYWRFASLLRQVHRRSERLWSGFPDSDDPRDAEPAPLATPQE